LDFIFLLGKVNLNFLADSPSQSYLFLTLFPHLLGLQLLAVSIDILLAKFILPRF
jgi:hypothetical protein